MHTNKDLRLLDRLIRKKMQDLATFG